VDPTANQPPPGHLPLGTLGRTFQLEGALRWRAPAGLAADDGSPDDLLARAVAAAKSLYVTGLGTVRVRAVRFNRAAGTLLLLEGVRDRTAAQRLVNAAVWLDPGSLPPRLADELASALAAPSAEEALVGLPVHVGDERVGTVESAELGGPNAVAVVALAAGGRCLLPLAAPYVTVTPAPTIVVTDPPPGLLEPQ